MMCGYGLPCGNMAMENGPLQMMVPIKHGDLPQLKGITCKENGSAKDQVFLLFCGFMSNLLQGRLMKGSIFFVFLASGSRSPWGNSGESMRSHKFYMAYMVGPFPCFLSFHLESPGEQIRCFWHVMSKFSKTPRKVISACGRARACASLVANFLASNGESIG